MKLNEPTKFHLNDFNWLVQLRDSEATCEITNRSVGYWKCNWIYFYSINFLFVSNSIKFTRLKAFQLPSEMREKNVELQRDSRLIWAERIWTNVDLVKLIAVWIASVVHVSKPPIYLRTTHCLHFNIFNLAKELSINKLATSSCDLSTFEMWRCESIFLSPRKMTTRIYINPQPNCESEFKRLMMRFNISEWQQSFITSHNVSISPDSA